MKNYLAGYLSVLPPVQRRRVVELLRKNEDYVYSFVSESEFAALIEQISKDHEQVSEYIPQTDELDSTKYNDFMAKVHTDLQVLFNEANLLDRAINNYRRLALSDLADLNNEVDALEVQIENLSLVADGEFGLIVRTEDFEHSTYQEDPNGLYADLYCDRDGTMLSAASVSAKHPYRTLGLSVRKSTNRVYDNNGIFTASIELLDQRGLAETPYGHEIEKAMDGSDTTYWQQIVGTQEEINMEMYGVDGPGAMAKFAVTFNSPCLISEISINPFGSYPLEVSAILYEQDVEYGANSNSIPPTQRYLVTEPLASTDVMTFSFPSVLVKRLIFVIKQKNYVYNNKIYSKFEIDENDVWTIISNDLSPKQRLDLFLDFAERGYSIYNGVDNE